MKLTDELQNKLGNAKSEDEVKKILEEAGVELTDTELNQVAGGRPLAGYQTEPRH